MNALQDKLTLLVEPLLASLGLRLWGLEFLPGGRGVLRVYIEKADGADGKGRDPERGGQGGAGIERDEQAGVDPGEQAEAERDEQAGVERSEQAGIVECSRASRLIGLTLDVEDLIEGAYVLEVSTPGLERVFFRADQLARYGGEVAELTLHAPLPGHPGRKKFTGRLEVPGGQGKSFRLDLLSPADLTPEDASPLDFDWEDVKKARLVYVPEKNGAPKPKERQKKHR